MRLIIISCQIAKQNTATECGKGKTITIERLSNKTKIDLSYRSNSILMVTIVP